MSVSARTAANLNTLLILLFLPVKEANHVVWRVDTYL